MSRQRRTSWIDVAHRAAHFRMLVRASEVSDLAAQASACEANHRRHVREREDAWTGWRDRVRSGTFHSHDDALRRGYQQHLDGAQRASGERLKDAEAGLADGQDRLRITLAERDALSLAVDERNERLRRQQSAASQKEADELWQVGRGKGPHED